MGWAAISAFLFKEMNILRHVVGTTTTTKGEFNLPNLSINIFDKERRVTALDSSDICTQHISK